MVFQQKFGNILRDVRAMRNCSAYKLAQITGIRETTIANYERGGAMPSVDRAEKLLAGLNVRIVLIDMLTGDEYQL